MSYTPKTFGMVLNRFFEILRGHWKTLISVGLIPAAGFALMMVAIAGIMFWKFLPLVQQNPQNPDPTIVFKIFEFVFPLYPVMLFIMSLYIAAIATVTTRINRGEQVTIGIAWQQAFSHVGRYFWLMIRMMLVILLPMIAILTVVIGGSAGLIALLSHNHTDSSNFVLLIPIIVLCYLGIMAYNIWVMIRFSFSYFASVSEDLTAAQSMARSWQLTRNAFWRIFGVVVVVYLIIYAAQFVVTIALEFVVLIVVLIVAAMGVTPQSPAFPFLIGIGAIILAAFFTLLYSFIHAALATALSILYEDQRMRLTTIQESTLIPPILPDEAQPA
jgi:hypothetical protein